MGAKSWNLRCIISMLGHKRRGIVNQDQILADTYLARYFWYRAAQMLRCGSDVVEVALKNGETGYVSDVIVRFKSGQSEYCRIDFRDGGRGYSNDGFASGNPSPLQRLYAAYVSLRKNAPDFTLNLVSNTIWTGSDDIAFAMRRNQTLPDGFCTSEPQSDMGQIRRGWQDRVGADDAAFVDFVSRLRFQLGFFGLDELNQVLSDRLQLAGLVRIGFSCHTSPYDDLARKFIINGQTTFDANSLRAACEWEGLVARR